MWTLQALSAGGLLWQDFRSAIRPVFFDTDIVEWRYASHGGTLFLVEHRERVFALTCSHVFGDLRDDRLFISGGKFPKKGAQPAPCKSARGPAQDRRPTVTPGRNLLTALLNCEILECAGVTVRSRKGSNFDADPHHCHVALKFSSCVGHRAHH
jgi:hypothetical protein